jgi:hypothetical protein
MGILLLLSLFVFTYGNCTFLATLQANSVKPPPQVMQWALGWECTQSVGQAWADRLSEPFLP